MGFQLLTYTGYALGDFELVVGWAHKSEKLCALLESCVPCKRQRRAAVLGGSGGILPQKMLKKRPPPVIKFGFLERKKRGALT